MSRILRTYSSGRFVVEEMAFEPEADQYVKPVEQPAAPAVDPRSPEALKRLYFAFLRQKRERERAARHLGRDGVTMPVPVHDRPAPTIAIGVSGPPAGALFTNGAGVTANSPIVRPVARQAVPLEILQRLAADCAAFTASDDA
ncbi:hypothetical protein ACUSIJ_03090 [Pseudochelatococcus sp. B33]